MHVTSRDINNKCRLPGHIVFRSTLIIINIACELVVPVHNNDYFLLKQRTVVAP
jgi:hypothetical protein